MLADFDSWDRRDPEDPPADDGRRLMSTASPRSPNVVWQSEILAQESRELATGLRGATVWFTGLPAAGKSTLARAVERSLLELGVPVALLDGENLRHGLTGDLGFSPAERTENARRIGHVAQLLAKAGVIALVSLITPYQIDRARARELHLQAGHPFVEVWLDTPFAVCEQRDTKCLYARARQGELTGVTGFDAPYEPPANPELTLTAQSPVTATGAVLRELRLRGLLGSAAESGDREARAASAESPLSAREREILTLIDKGLSNKEIASRLSIRLSTVKNHVHHILEKLDVQRRGAAVALVRGAGW